HQEAIDFDTPLDASKPMAHAMLAKFSWPYEVYRKGHGRPPRRVLILGAGTGNDAAVAVRNGASEVTAVEIDPLIADLGRRLNPARPYADPRVRLVVDDGRHFLWNARDRYDMVVFGTLDSHTLLSGQVNLRLDNYIYTAESFRAARAVLEPDGLAAAYFSAWKPWLAERVYSTAGHAFERVR